MAIHRGGEVRRTDPYNLTVQSSCGSGRAELTRVGIWGKFGGSGSSKPTPAKAQPPAKTPAGKPAPGKPAPPKVATSKTGTKPFSKNKEVSAPAAVAGGGAK